MQKLIIGVFQEHVKHKAHKFFWTKQLDSCTAVESSNLNCSVINPTNLSSKTRALTFSMEVLPAHWPVPSVH